MAAAKEEIDRQKKSLAKRKPVDHINKRSKPNAAMNSNSNDGFLKPENPKPDAQLTIQEYYQAEEILKVHRRQ